MLEKIVRTPLKRRAFNRLALLGSAALFFGACGTEEDECSSYKGSGWKDLEITPNPTREALEVTLKCESHTFGSGEITEAHFYIDGKKSGNMKPADGNFGAEDYLIGTADIEKLGLDVGIRHPVRFGIKTSKGCADFFRSPIIYLYPTTKNMLAAGDWNLLGTILREGSGGFIDFSWNDAAVQADYNFKGGPTQFIVRAVTKCGQGNGYGDYCPTGDCCGEGVLSLDIDGLRLWSSPIAEKTEKDFIIDGWHEYLFYADITPGQHSVKIAYSNDDWGRDVYFDRLEIIEQ